MTWMVYLRYAVVFLAVAIGTGMVVRALGAGDDSMLGVSLKLMVPAMIAALVEGGRFARGHKRRPLQAETWGFVWIATVIATALNVLLAYAAGALLPEFAKLAIAETLSRQFIILLGLYAGGYLVCNRMFWGLGSSNTLSIMRSRGEID